MICDVCGYEDKSKLGVVVQEESDGVRRCKKCRHQKLYGRYIHDEQEEEKAWRKLNGLDN